MKRRSQTYRERKKKDLAAEEPKEDPAQPEEVKSTAAHITSGIHNIDQ